MRGIAVALGVLAAAAAAQELEEPVRLKAGGKNIDTGAHIAHAGPLYADYTGDGVPDLLVGNFRGHIQAYRNTGTRTAPAFEDDGLLQAEGEPIRIHNW